MRTDVHTHATAVAKGRIVDKGIFQVGIQHFRVPLADEDQNNREQGTGNECSDHDRDVGEHFAFETAAGSDCRRAGEVESNEGGHVRHG